MATEIWVNIGSDNPAITWTNVDRSSVKSNDIHIREISQEMPQRSITKICLKITCLKFHSNFPGANELIPGCHGDICHIWLVQQTACLVYRGGYQGGLWQAFVSNSDIHGLVHHCSNSTALAVELLQSCTKPSIMCILLNEKSHVLIQVLLKFVPQSPLNSLWSSDTVWRQRSGSTLVRVMACCLMAPSHYLNQCWLIISEVQRQTY